MKPCDQNLQKVLSIVEDMITIARKGDAEREDTGCGILYGRILDAAYKIKRIAEEEKNAHIKKGGGTLLRK